MISGDTMVWLTLWTPGNPAAQPRSPLALRLHWSARVSTQPRAHRHEFLGAALITAWLLLLFFSLIYSFCMHSELEQRKKPEHTDEAAASSFSLREGERDAAAPPETRWAPVRERAREREIEREMCAWSISLAEGEKNKTTTSGHFFVHLVNSKAQFFF